MQERYIADAGDFGKYGLLNFLVEATKLRLGIIWYHTKPEGLREGHLGDGKHRKYLVDPKLRQFPEFAELLTKLSKYEDMSLRSFSHLQSAGVLPSDTIFYDEEVGERAVWFGESTEAMKNADIVFLDPDNGFMVPSAKGKKTAKYVAFEEAIELFNSGKSLVIYQHQPRQKLPTLEAGIRKQLGALPKPVVLSYRRGTARHYFIFPAPKHRVEIEHALAAFRSSNWFKEKKLRLFS